MKGLGPFLIGAVIGGGAVFASLSYHFVKTKDGFETIPKLTPTFSETYVDATAFTAADWTQHQSLTAAILRANKGHIIGDAAVNNAAEGLQDFVNGVIPPAPANP